MPSRRFHAASALPLRRTVPRCHGGASSMLRLGLGAAPQRAVPGRMSGWLGRPTAVRNPASGVEHVLGGASLAGAL
ncbi:MAG: hypothetical protein ABI641_10455 [Caldimonas sp.]